MLEPVKNHWPVADYNKEKRKGTLRTSITGYSGAHSMFSKL